MDLSNISEEIVDDETSDHNLRYIGVNPNNYVEFNNELWRIIGVMNDVADESGIIEPRIKLIRNENIGLYTWDNKVSGTGSSKSDLGSNDWTDSVLMKVLNEEPYYNSTIGKCPQGILGATVDCDFSSTGLKSESKNLVSKVKWKLGGMASYQSNTYGLTNHWYNSERGTKVYSGRPKEWIGSVGLMYPSDYGYATAGGESISRSDCLNIAIYNWKSSNYVDCKNNNWLLPNSTQFNQYTLTPYSSDNYSTFSICSKDNCSDFVLKNTARTSTFIRPVVFLTTKVKIKSGTGTSTDPFILSL